MEEGKTEEVKKIERYARRPMTVMMERTGSRWQVIGILPSSQTSDGIPRRELVRDGGDTCIYRWEGLDLLLTPDACDDYWFNLTSAQPRVYVICQTEADGEPVPLRITANQDESVAAEEVEELFYQAAMPANVVFWIREYVATHYRPGPRKQKIKGKKGDKYLTPFDVEKP
ncbi:MAG TPA: DUF3305 domain-containing protein [Wenzhouxiangella sp.]|nr:DUF3305 domain-containing protein [Wenzhouxiangella sp.]